MDLSLDEISQVIRIVREVSDRWDDPAGWRGHLLKSACALLKGNVATMFAVGAAEPGQFGAVRPIAIFGLPEPGQRALVQTATDTISHREFQEIDQNFLPGQTKFFDDFRRHGSVTVAREQLSDVESYHASPAYRNFRRGADCDDYLWSMRFVDLPRRMEMFGVDRPHGAPSFGPREVMLLKLLHDEIAPLIGVRLTTEEHFCRDGLSKRLRETLSRLLEGKSEKQIAAALQLRPGTVHDYITSIYRHFDVSSRAELMAYFVHRAPKLRSQNQEGAG